MQNEFFNRFDVASKETVSTALAEVLRTCEARFDTTKLVKERSSNENELCAMTKEVLENSISQIMQNLSDDAVQKFVMLLKKLSENDKLISLKCLAFVLNKKELFAFDQTPMHAYSAVILAEVIRVCTNIKTNVQRKEYLEQVVD
jgi:archaellum biogenesis ATPase FlaH